MNVSLLYVLMNYCKLDMVLEGVISYWFQTLFYFTRYTKMNRQEQIQNLSTIMTQTQPDVRESMEAP